MKQHLKAIEEAVRAIRLEQIDAEAKARNRVTYIIWKNEEHRNISDHAEVVGLFTGTYEEADALIDRLNKADPSVSEGFGGRVRHGYFRTEPTVITAQVEKEIVDSLK